MNLTALVSKAGFGTQECHCNDPIKNVQKHNISSVVKSNSKYDADLAF